MNLKKLKRPCLLMISPHPVSHGVQKQGHFFSETPLRIRDIPCLLPFHKNIDTDNLDEVFRKSKIDKNPSPALVEQFQIVENALREIKKGFERDRMFVWDTFNSLCHTQDLRDETTKEMQKAIYELRRDLDNLLRDLGSSGKDDGE